MTNKEYVDDAIAAITAPQLFDYEVTNSTSGDTVYYINGDLLLYATEEDGLINYTITVYGTNLDDVTGADLHARGNSHDLTDVDTDGLELKTTLCYLHGGLHRHPVVVRRTK